MTRVTEILKRMATVAKPQQKFLITLFTTILVLRGRMNFLNMSRYSDLSERTFRRQFRKEFDWTEFNRLSIAQVIAPTSTQILAQDASFISKSGKHTYGLDYFFNSCHSRAERGLEVSLISLIDVSSNIGYALSVKQTRARTDQSATLKKKRATREVTRIDDYLEHLRSTRPHVPESVCYAVFDGYYAKRKFVSGVCQMDLHLVSKLRADANLRYLYTGRQKKRGRPRLYNGKVRFNDLRRFQSLGEVDENIHLYTAIVNHQRLERNIRIVVVVNLEKKEKPRYALLFSTDTALTAEEIYRYYKARFQIEFLFRDAKQFTGLEDCQARDQRALDFHFNASLAAVNLAKIEAIGQHTGDEGMVFSLASLKQRYFNEHLLELIISKLEIEPNVIKSHPDYEYLCSYGAIAA